MCLSGKTHFFIMIAMIVNFSALDNLPSIALTQAIALGERPALWAKKDGTWISTSWAEMADQIKALAGGLIHMGLQPGERVVLLSENRPEWGIADLAIMAAGGVTVPVYITNTVQDHHHILSNSQAKFAIVSGPALADRFLSAAWTGASPIQVVSIEPLQLAQASSPTPMLWSDVITLGRTCTTAVDIRLRTIGRDDLACLIYTSGTGGAPKGVMLSHGSILANCRGGASLLAQLGLDDDDVFLSFLPLSHAYEHTAGLMLPLCLGAQIYYAESIDQLSANMAETHPTIMTAVPRLYDTIRARILRQMDREGGLKAKLFYKAVELGRKRFLGQPIGLIDRLINLILDILVRNKVRARFGGRLKALVSGGAALPLDIGLFFAALGVRILQGYGQTEFSPCISCSPPGKIKLDTVGPPMEGTSVRIADDGEILVAGESIMKGYWNDPDATKRAIPDGKWLHTGDVGELDLDGYIRITDRKKDIIVVSGGDTISPQRLEGLLTLEPEISQAMIIGDGKAHLAALIVPESGFAEGVAQAVERVNKSLNAIEKIRKFTLLPAAFTIENGMLTPSMKIRRHIIKETYTQVIREL